VAGLVSPGQARKAAQREERPCEVGKVLGSRRRWRYYDDGRPARLGGPGRVAVIGCLVNVGAMTLWLAQIQAQPAYLTHLLPAQLLGGAGVGLAIPSLLGAGSLSLSQDRFGTGSGILNMARQVGTVLGVAALVAILARVGPEPVTTFRHATALVIAFFTAAGLIAAILLTGKARPPLRRPPRRRKAGEQARAAGPSPNGPGGSVRYRRASWRRHDWPVRTHRLDQLVRASPGWG
jgi:hypothetical protein